MGRLSIRPGSPDFSTSTWSLLLRKLQATQSICLHCLPMLCGSILGSGWNGQPAQMNSWWLSTWSARAKTESRLLLLVAGRYGEDRIRNRLAGEFAFVHRDLDQRSVAAASTCRCAAPHVSHCGHCLLRRRGLCSASGLHLLHLRHGGLHL